MNTSREFVRGEILKENKIVKAHNQHESIDFEEVFEDHIDRAQASQAEFDNAKKFLTKVYGGKRCVVCELRGEEPHGHVESHHVIEWAHWTQIVKAYNGDEKLAMASVGAVLRSLSYFIHGLYLISRQDLLDGKTIPSLWEHPELKDKPFTSLDDPRNQYFLCHAHHQQATKEEIEDGEDVIGLHHIPLPQWILYLVLPMGFVPVRHIDHHDDGLDRKV